MKQEQDNIIDGLLGKYLAGEATDAEKETVQQWLNESKANKEYYNDLKLIWSQSRLAAPQSTVDENEAWQRFSALTQTQRKVVTLPARPSYTWLKAAAILLLLAGGGYMAYNFSTQNKEQVAITVPAHTPARDTAITATQPAPVAAIADTEIKEIPAYKKNNAVVRSFAMSKTHDRFLDRQEQDITLQKRHKGMIFSQRRHSMGYNNSPMADDDLNTNDFVCNTTKCPLEICITQTLQCGINKPSTASTCSIIEPDQSGQLCYKDTNKTDRNCALTVDQITIKKISTGETILLTADSKPSTAWQVFNYITGKEKGDILAGNFQDDCGEQPNEHGLRIDNLFGDLRLQ